jgi:hypothetical protein
MNDFLTQAETFLNASVLPDLQAAGAQGTAALRKLADYLDGQLAGLKFAGPDDGKRCADLLKKCHECQAQQPKGGLTIGSGLIVSVVLNAIQSFLSQWLTQQNPTAPATA